MGPKSDGTLQALAGVRLAIGVTRQGWYSIDNRAGNGADLVVDLEAYPWPLPDACAVQAYAGHVINRIDPTRWGFVRWMNEVHRLLVPNGELMIACYYGANHRYLSDPAACNPVTEATFYWFDPGHKSGLWDRYQPLPWQVRDVAWDVAGNLEVLLGKR